MQFLLKNILIETETKWVAINLVKNQNNSFLFQFSMETQSQKFSSRNEKNIYLFIYEITRIVKSDKFKD